MIDIEGSPISELFKASASETTPSIVSLADVRFMECAITTSSTELEQAQHLQFDISP